MRLQAFGGTHSLMQCTTHEASPVLLRDDTVDELHLPEDGALATFARPQQEQLDLFLLCFVVL